MCKRVPVYESFVEGAKEGFKVGVMIIPYLVAIFVAINMFRASGAMGAMEDALRPMLTAIGFPPEVLPMAIIRPLTGGGSAGRRRRPHPALRPGLADHPAWPGPCSAPPKPPSTSSPSTSARSTSKKQRHALPAGLIADVVAIFLSVYIIRWFFG